MMLLSDGVEPVHWIAQFLEREEQRCGVMGEDYPVKVIVAPDAEA